MARRLRWALGGTLAAAGVGATILLAFGGHAFLNYDTLYALVWGDELRRGLRPRYDLPVAPTPHPLAIAVGALVSPLGDRAEEVLLALGLLALGALGVGLVVLGRELFAWPVGVLAALVLLTRVPILNYGIRGYVDLPAVALVVWAAVLEARRPRRGTPVLVLLLLAGLLRPEVWLLSAAYWAWLALGRVGGLARLLPLAAGAPVLWALSDLLVTGNPLWSLTGTAENAAALERPTGLARVPEVLPRRLGEILRLPELLAAVAGFAAALRWLPRRVLLPTALGLANGVAYLGFALAGLPLLGRYLFLAAAVLSLLAAVGALGWTALPHGHPGRRAWRAGGAVVLVGLALFAPVQVERLRVLRDDIAARDVVQDDLHRLVRSPEAAAALRRCGALYVPNHRPVPALALWTGRRPGQILSARLTRPGPRGVFLAPATAEVERLSILDPRDPGRFSAAVPPGWERMAANRSWRLYAACAGAPVAGAPRQRWWTVHPASRPDPGRARQSLAPARLPRGA